MAIKQVVKMGNTALLSPSLPLENFKQQGLNYPGLKELLQDMQDTMHATKGVGIAAPQIGSNLRVIMFGFEKSDRYPEMQPIPFTVVINPVIKILSEVKVDGWEGCLSVPGLRGVVPRYDKIQYSGLTPEGEEIERVVDGFHARVVQHECDHLDGILFPRRINDLRRFGFEDVLTFD
ncbi:MAG: peptide deformylase [Legionella sp.]|nr:peptide deformylase [Legionella sp.]